MSDILFNVKCSYELCEDLSLRRDIPDILRDQARYQLYFHLKSAPDIFPSWKSRQLDFVAPPGWMQMNPSITNFNDKLYVALRCCYYTVSARGPSQIEGTPYFSRTFLLSVKSAELDSAPIAEITLNLADDCFKPGVPSSFEDLRIFPYKDAIWGSMTRCTQNPEGWPEQWIGRIPRHFPFSDTLELTNLQRLTPEGKRQPQKNWMPFVTDIPLLGETLCFIYLCDPTTILAGSRRISKDYPAIDASNFRGSTQAIALDGGWLALIHSLIMYEGYPKYHHRFIWLSSDYKLIGISPAFVLPSNFESEIQNGYQYIMGLCWHPDERRLILSYSIGDCQSWLATIDASDVQREIRDVT